MDAFDADAFSGESITVTGQPTVGHTVEIGYESSTHGAWAPEPGSITTASGELLYIEPQFGSDDKLVAVIRDAENNRAVSVGLESPPDKFTGNTVRTLKPGRTKRGKRIGSAVSVTFTDEAINQLGPATVAMRAVKAGDTVLVDGTEYGVVDVSLRGPSDRRSHGMAILTRPAGSEYTLSTRPRSGITFKERHGDALTLDPATVRVGRQRERYYNHENQGIDPEPTDDAFPAPHGGHEGDRLTFTLCGQDGVDGPEYGPEQVTGEVTDVRYYERLVGHLMGGPEEQPPATEIALDDGRTVRLKDAPRNRGGGGTVRAFVTYPDVSAPEKSHHIEAENIEVID